ncbi:MAG: Uma2 family endonuclease [Acaryochloridaceae cyanobacterium RL_2_7]|nr:Uma2 family endonuclease [Acaryochloridaceae cyanobacterium RL_2_7]
MTSARQFYEQQPNLSVIPPRKDWPTMYDLPSEDSQEPGLPDEFHLLQPQLLTETLRLPNVAEDEVFIGSDLNLYYDPHHTLWYKRPDWFAVAGVPRFYDGHDLRLSYVVWDEQVNPFIIVELLSPKTAQSDLGEDESEADETPTKWKVYQDILKVPYYVVFDRYDEKLRVFKRENSGYQAQEISNDRYWLDDMGVGIGVWCGEFKQNRRLWLRWFDADGAWIPIKNKKLSGERSRADRLAEKLRALGINPDEV